MSHSKPSNGRERPVRCPTIPVDFEIQDVQDTMVGLTVGAPYGRRTSTVSMLSFDDGQSNIEGDIAWDLNDAFTPGDYIALKILVAELQSELQVQESRAKKCKMLLADFQKRQIRLEEENKLLKLSLKKEIYRRTEDGSAKRTSCQDSTDTELAETEVEVLKQGNLVLKEIFSATAKRKSSFSSDSSHTSIYSRSTTSSMSTVSLRDDRRYSSEETEVEIDAYTIDSFKSFSNMIRDNFPSLSAEIVDPAPKDPSSDHFDGHQSFASCEQYNKKSPITKKRYGPVINENDNFMNRVRRTLSSSISTATTALSFTSMEEELLDTSNRTQWAI